MKIPWFITSLIAGIAASIISYLLIKSWQISLLLGLLVFIVVLINNPKKRFFAAAWAILSMFLVLNRYFFEVVGNIEGIDFKIGANEIHPAVSIALLILAGLAFILDILERNNKLDSLLSFTFFRIKGNATIYKDINTKGGDFIAGNKIEQNSKSQE